MTDRALEAAGILKTFPDTVALDHVSLTLARGEVHALTGENGAGKSTLVKVLTGVHRPEAGRLRRDGEPLRGRPAGRPPRGHHGGPPGRRAHPLDEHRPQPVRRRGAEGPARSDRHRADARTGHRHPGRLRPARGRAAPAGDAGPGRPDPGRAGPRGHGRAPR
ncbi:ATP-binding cassette domain-containing protein [Actinoallomurus acanthiterrae]